MRDESFTDFVEVNGGGGCWTERFASFVVWVTYFVVWFSGVKFLLLLLFRFSFCLLPSAAPDAVDGPAAAVLATDHVPVVLWHGESPHARAHLV